jgi:hypothetical protein
VYVDKCNAEAKKLSDLKYVELLEKTSRLERLKRYMFHLITRSLYIITGNGCATNNSLSQALSNFLLLITGIFLAFTNNSIEVS